MQLRNSSSQNLGKLLTLFYNIVTPFFKILMYMLRNKELKGPLRMPTGGNVSLIKKL